MAYSSFGMVPRDSNKVQSMSIMLVNLQSQCTLLRQYPNGSTKYTLSGKPKHQLQPVIDVLLVALSPCYVSQRAELLFA